MKVEREHNIINAYKNHAILELYDFNGKLLETTKMNKKNLIKTI